MDDRRFKRWLLIICLLALVLRWWGLYGSDVHLDESAYSMVGGKYVSALFRGDFTSPDWNTNVEHPPVAKLLYGLAFKTQVIPIRVFHWFRAPKYLAGLIGLGAVFLIGLIGRRLYGPAAGLGAALALATMPQALAHSRIAGLEGPSLFFWTLALYCLLRAVEAGPRPGWWLALGAACGLAFGTRFNNGLVLAAVGFTILALLSADLFTRPDQRPAELRFPGWAWPTWIWPLVAAVVFWLTWPYLWHDLAGRLTEVFTFHSTRAAREWFWGRLVQPPWYYYLVYLALTTPPIALAAGAWFLGRTARRPGRADAVIFIWLAAPLAMSLLSLKADGLRYVYPVLAGLSLAVGRGGQLAAQWATARFSRAKLAFGPLIIGLIGLGCLYSSLSVWPYQLDYYNFAAGSAGEIQSGRLLKIAWWGEGLQAAVDWVNDHASRGAKIGQFSKPHNVLDHTDLRPDLIRVSPYEPNQTDLDLREADYVVTNVDLDRPDVMNRRFAAWDLVFEQKLGGASLARVYRRKK